MVDNKKETLPVMCILCLFMSHPIYRCLKFLLSEINVHISDNMSLIWFGLLSFSIYVYARYHFQFSKIIVLASAYLFYIINYGLSVSTARQYYTQGDVMTVLLIYIPICSLMINPHTKWELLFQKRIFLCIVDIIIILSFLAKFTYNDYSDYMSFSYDLLPAWNITLISAIFYNKKTQWIFLIIGVLEGFLFGARGPILWLAICVILIDFQVINFNKEKSAKHIIGLIIAIVMLCVFIEIIVPHMIDSTYFRSSYILKRINFGSLTDNSDRQNLYIICKEIISNMGLNVYGLFYDRTVLPEASGTCAKC